MEPTRDHLVQLTRYFGHTEFRPLQWKVISSIIKERRDNSAVLSSGYGKKLCYQYPPLFCEGLGIIVSPHTSLIKDEVLFLKGRNIPACFLDNAGGNEESTDINNICRGNYRLVYVTPEWCSTEYGVKIFKKFSRSAIKIILIAIDEAHCVSQSSHEFKQCFRSLKKLRKILIDVPFVTMTDTATPKVKADIISFFKLRNPQEISSSFDKPNLFLSVYMQTDLLFGLKAIINKHKTDGTYGPTILYSRDWETANNIYSKLTDAGFKCSICHNHFPIEFQEEACVKFVKDIVDIFITTMDFEMGRCIDKPDVRLVIHYGAPKDIELYYQEISRGGRDGLPSTCYAFYSYGDFKLRGLSCGLPADFKAHKEDMQHMMDLYLMTNKCRRKLLVKHFDPNFILDEDRDPKSCCDNCVRWGPNDSRTDLQYDLTHDALLLLSAIKEMSEIYALATYILLLIGSYKPRLPRKFRNSSLFGAGLPLSEKWWTLLGELLIKESLIENTVSTIGKGWNKNNLPRKIVKVTQRGNHYLDTGGGILHLKPSIQMLLIIHTMPRKDESGAFSFCRPNTVYEFIEPDESSSSNAALENDLFRELMNFRGKIAEKLHCMPHRVLDNKIIQELSSKKPKTIEELSSVEGITEEKIQKFGKECLECIAKVVESQGTGRSTRKNVSMKRFVKNIVLNPSPQVFRSEDENTKPSTGEVPIKKVCIENKYTEPSTSGNQKAPSSSYEGLEKKSGNDVIRTEADRDVLAAVGGSALKDNSNLCEAQPGPSSSSNVSLEARNKTPKMSQKEMREYVERLIQINEEKKKSKKLKIL